MHTPSTASVPAAQAQPPVVSGYQPFATSHTQSSGQSGSYREPTGHIFSPPSGLMHMVGSLGFTTIPSGHAGAAGVDSYSMSLSPESESDPDSESDFDPESESAQPESLPAPLDPEMLTSKLITESTSLA